MMLASVASNDGPWSGLALIGVGLLIYFIPAIVARGKTQANPVFVLNFFLGWTLVGWVAALVWAVSNQAPQPVIIQYAAPIPHSGSFCSKCGAPSAGAGRFCGACGSAMTASI